MSNDDLKLMMREAAAHFGAGRMDRAQALSEQVLGCDRRHPGALQMLGLIAMGRGDFEAAVGLLSESLKGAPQVAEFHNNLGEALAGTKRFGEAINCYRRAI